MVEARLAETQGTPFIANDCRLDARVRMLEALACGLPVAAFPVAGPKDVVREGEVGALDWDLAKAVERAIALPRAACRRYAESFSWEAATRQFIANLAPVV